MSPSASSLLVCCLIAHAIFYCYILIAASRYECKMRRFLKKSESMKYF